MKSRMIMNDLIMNNFSFVVLGLGSNLGDRLANLRGAVAMLGEIMSIERVSKIYHSPPMYMSEQPDFLNMALCGYYEASPTSLMFLLKQIEAQLGRQKNSRYGPRLIDLDIIFFENVVYSEEELTIPHAKMQERAFVLVPLMDICADFVHPLLGKPVSVLHAELGVTVKLACDVLSLDEIADFEHA